MWILPHFATEVNTQVRTIPQKEGGPVFGESLVGFDGQIRRRHWYDANDDQIDKASRGLRLSREAAAATSQGR